MSAFKEAPISGLYSTMRSVFKALRDDQILCKYLYYPSTDMDDDPTLKNDVSNEAKDEIISPTIKVDELEGTNQTKRGKVTFGLGTILKSYQNHKSSKPYIHIYVYVPRYGFQDIDFRQEAIIDRIEQIVSDKRFDGSFGRLINDGGNPYDAPKGYIGYVIRYGFNDTDF